MARFPAITRSRQRDARTGLHTLNLRDQMREDRVGTALIGRPLDQHSDNMVAWRQIAQRIDVVFVNRARETGRTTALPTTIHPDAVASIGEEFKRRLFDGFLQRECMPEKYDLVRIRS